MAKFRNVGSNPICLRGGRVINPNEEFTPGRYEAAPRAETNLATGAIKRFPPETGDEVDETMLAFLFQVGALAQIADEPEIHEFVVEHEAHE